MLKIILKDYNLKLFQIILTKNSSCEIILHFKSNKKRSF